MPKRDPAQLKKVSLSLPFGIGKAEWESDPTERRAAWSLYVELVTRISVQKDALPEGAEKEAITSLYSLFGVTRDILKSAGPDIGKTKDSVGAIALAVLNRGVRPFLTKWHTKLNECPPSENPAAATGAIRNWPERDEFLDELEILQDGLAQYATALAAIAGVEAIE